MRCGNNNKNEERQAFLKDAEYTLYPLKEWLSVGGTLKGSEIKNDYELLLVYQMIHDIQTMPVKTINAIDKKEEQASFEKARKKMIEFINIFNERKIGYKSVIFEDNLKTQLEDLRYEPPNTKQNLKLTKREIYLKMMHAIGIGKERATNIIQALERFNTYRNSLNNDKRSQFDCELLKWDSWIDLEYKAKAQRYFFNIFNNCIK